MISNAAFIIISKLNNLLSDRNMQLDDQIEFLLIYFQHFSAFFDYMSPDIYDKNTVLFLFIHVYRFQKENGCISLMFT